MCPGVYGMCGRLAVRVLEHAHSCQLCCSAWFASQQAPFSCRAMLGACVSVAAGTCLLGWTGCLGLVGSRVVLHCAMLQWRCGLVCLLACSSTCLTGSRTRKACPPSAAGHTACAAVKCRVRDPCSCRGCVGVKDADGMACWWLRVGQGVAPCLAASWQGASGGQAPSQTMFWVLCVCHTGRGERAAAVQSVRASAGALVDGCLLLNSGPVLSAACAMFGGASNRALTRALAAQRLQALAGTSACTQRSITCWGGGCQLRPTPPPASVHVCFAAHTE